MIEVLVASLILTAGLTSVAWLFAYSARIRLTNEQRTVATLLVHEKLEALLNAPLTSSAWNSGRYSQEQHGYLQTWEIEGALIRTVTVTVYSRTIWIQGKRLELARAQTKVAP